MRPRTLRLCILTLLAVALHGLRASGQNLIYNGDFNLMSAGWTTSCVSVEAYAFETTYGGTDPTNHVAEIDDEACMHQDVCVLPGASYVFSMDASRRTAGGPNPVTTHLDISGLDASSTVVGTYVSMDFTRTNTVFALTAVTGIPTITVPTGAGVVRLRITLTDNTPGYSTLGMIVDNLSLVASSSAAIVPGGSDTICMNVPLSFSVPAVGTTGISYVWSFGGSATPVTSTLSSPAASWSTSGTDVVTAVLGNGVCYIDTVTYHVFVNPAITVSLHDTTCATVPYIFRGVSHNTSGVYSDTVAVPGGCDSIINLYLYIKPPVLTNIYGTICGGHSYVFNGHAYTVSGVYTDTFLTAVGCDSMSALNLTVNAIPPKPTVTPVAYCQFDVASPVSATGTSLMWYGTGLTAGYTTAPTPATTLAAIDTYYVTQTVLGCISDSAMAIVTINTKPYPPIVTDVFYCENQPAVALTATGSGLLWYSYSSGGPASSSAPVPTTTSTGTQTWYVSEVVNGCESDRSAINVKVAAYPVSSILNSTVSICQHDSASFTYSGDSLATGYAWQLPGDGTLVDGSMTGPGVVVKFDTPGKQYIYLAVEGPGGKCNAIDTAIISVTPDPAASPATTNNVCIGDTVGLGLGNHSDNAYFFVWTLNNDPLFTSGYVSMITHDNNSGGPFTIRWDQTGTFIIGLSTQSKEGCMSASTFDTVKVYGIPNAAFTVETNISALCLEDSVLFKAVETGNDYYYLWSPSAFFNSINEPDAWGKMTQLTNTVSLTVTDPYGCKATTSMEINPSPCCTITFPSAFTPNGDSRNDVFRPISTGYHKLHKMVIMNRWGQTVFESANNEMEWDGNYNGIPQDMAVYYYFISYDCGGNTLEQKGDVTLIR